MTITRRSILRSGALLGAGAAIPMSLGAMPALAQQSGYKALVCVFFAGGLDGHDCVIPYDAASYAEYEAVRRTLIATYDAEPGLRGSRSREALVPLTSSDPSASGSRRFALAPQMADLAPLFSGGRLSIVSNVGPLVEPTDRAAMDAGRVRLPPRLMSHNDQQSLWQTMQTEGANTGWGGRMSDALFANSPFATVSASGNSTFLAGRASRGYQIGTFGAVQVSSADGFPFGSNQIAAALREHYQAESGVNNLFARDIAQIQADSVATSRELAALWNSTNAGSGASVPGNGLSGGLATVARTISLRQQLGVNRQVFFVQAGGFDSHITQAKGLPGLQRMIASALAAFQAELDRMGVADSVTTFTASDFGRTLQSNASGTDHGWGNHHFVMGGAVKGGRIVGDFPRTVLGHGQDFGRGRLIPTTSIEQYAGDLGRWFGLSEGALGDVFPNRGRFDTAGLGLF